MKLEIKREWCLAAARREGDAEVGAGRIAFDPEPEIEAAAPSVQTMPVEAMQLAFGKLVNFMRRKQSWSIDELARRSKVDAAELLLIEKDHHQADPYAVSQLANVFSLPVKPLQQLSGLTVVRDQQVVSEAVRFAASSDPIERLSPEQARAVENFVATLNRLADEQKNS
jgi:hypothetical protein